MKLVKQLSFYKEMECKQIQLQNLYRKICKQRSKWSTKISEQIMSMLLLQRCRLKKYNQQKKKHPLIRLSATAT